tara:strand:- start:33087 stop:34412 length:1326 start_codon:yes stop_codon:yes gene_type:complete
MHKTKHIASTVLLALMIGLLACQQNSENKAPTFPSPAAPSSQVSADWPKGLTKEQYYDKVLGMLVGSAIGDAMGAPTEMWHRSGIQAQFGFVDSLDAVTREGSPEGPWEDNLAAGGTTDDTRWKLLMGNYLTTQAGKDSLDAKAFASHIIDLYKAEMQQVKEIDAFGPEAMERQLMHMTWLQEWAKVAKPFADDDLQGYSYAVNRFYGGEMACAGMLYSPSIGGFYPGQPQKAYTEAYRLGFFDHGYARDITGLTAAYVAKAMEPGVKPEQIALITREVDPLRYFNSRLIGRLAYASYTASREITHIAEGLTEKDIDQGLRVPKNFKGSRLEYAQLSKAYELMDGRLQDIPFHAGEIHFINLVALEYSEGDFQKAMEFVVNYGRDNDTVAAITGAILGAYWGYSGLPKGLKEKSLKATKELVGIDLEDLARRTTEAAYRGD